MIEGFPLKVENDRNLFEARNCRFFDALKLERAKVNRRRRNRNAKERVWQSYGYRTRGNITRSVRGLVARNLLSNGSFCSSHGEVLN